MTVVNKPIVIGHRNNVTPGIDGLVAIGCNETEFSNEDDGYLYLQNKALVIDPDGITTSFPGVWSVTVTSGTTTTSAQRYKWYFCDASAGNITITMVHDNVPKVFKRIDSSVNTVELVPESGLIDGAASKFLISLEKIEVGSDGSNFWF